MKILEFIKNKKLVNMQKKRTERRLKWYAIRGAVIKFYEEKDLTDGNPVNIPVFQRADQIMDEVIKSTKDLDFYYNRLKKYGVA